LKGFFSEVSNKQIYTKELRSFDLILEVIVPYGVYISYLLHHARTGIDESNVISGVLEFFLVMYYRCV
jgi:hypothetical protein